MAATVTLDSGQNGRGCRGDVFVRRGTINLGTYATGGVAVTKATFDFAVSLLHIDLGASAGYTAEWIPSTGNVKVYDQKDPAAAGGADIAQPEVGNAVSLAAVNFRFLAEGR